jgi:hypothetical protein
MTRPEKINSQKTILKYLRLKNYPAKGICGICVTLFLRTFLHRLFFPVGVQVLMLITYLKSAHEAALIFKLEEFVNVRGNIVPCRVWKPFLQTFLRLRYKKLYSLIVNFL